MARVWRMALVLLMATSILAVVPGAASATPPGAIGRIVFVSDADDPIGDIYVRDASGSQPTRITTDSAREQNPKWSPDGTRIAFSRASATVGDVWVMDPDGANAVNLTNGVGTNTPYDWSPDGTRILYSSTRGGNRDLWVMYADGSNPQQLTNSPDTEWGAAWSPDGTTIVFSRTVGSWVNLFLMDTDGSNVRSLTTGSPNTGEPTWSPDGTKIAFTSGTGSDLDIWVMGSDGSNPANLTKSPTSNDHGPAWSPDGERIAFVSNRDGDGDLWTMTPHGTDLAHLTDHSASEWSVDWESVNRLPRATDDEAIVHRGQTVSIDLLRNDSDPDGDRLTLGDVTRMPMEGSVSIEADGVVGYQHNGTTVPPNHAVPYTDSFEYRVDDDRLGSATGTVQVWIYPYFDDVPQANVFFEDVIWLAVQRVTLGCNPPDNTLFCPEEFVTRGQMAAFLVRARNYTDGAGADMFVDDNGSVFELDIDKLGTAGVTRGCNPPVNDQFCPGALVTRGQMAAFLARAFQLTDQGRHDLFVDDNGSLFETDIDKLGATGVSKGCNPPANDRFCPDDYVTRQQMAAFISRAVNWGQE